MKTIAKCYNVGSCGGVDRVVGFINKYVSDYNAEIVNIAYTGGNLIVVYKVDDHDRYE